MNNIVFDEENPVTSERVQRMWQGCFGMGKMVNMRIYLKRKTQSKRRKRLSKCQ